MIDWLIDTSRCHRAAQFGTSRYYYCYYWLKIKSRTTWFRVTRRGAAGTTSSRCRVVRTVLRCIRIGIRRHGAPSLETTLWAHWAIMPNSHRLPDTTQTGLFCRVWRAGVNWAFNVVSKLSVLWRRIPTRMQRRTVRTRVVHGSILFDPTRPKPIQLTIELTV